MGSTLIYLNVHIVFGTKHHLPVIDKSWRSDLHAYLGGCLRNLKAVPTEINGHIEHVHVLASLRSTHRISDVLREIKSASSEWVHGKVGLRSFDWQDGYAAYSVNWRDVPRVREYIRRQEDHHRTVTFRDEYLRLLSDHGVAYDPRYVF